MKRPAIDLVRPIAGLGIATLASAAVDRLAAVVVRDAPPRSALAWLAALGGHAVLVLAAGIVVGALALLARRFAEPRRAAVVVAAVAGVIALPAFAIAGAEITEGPWISAQSWSPLVRHGVAWGGAVAVALVAALVVASPPGRARLVDAGLLVGAIAAAFLDVAVAPGRMPAAHRVALVGSVVAFALVGLRVARLAQWSRRRTIAIAVAGALVPAAGVVALANASPGLRAELLLHAPATATLLRAVGGGDRGRLLALLSTPMPPSDADADAPDLDAPRDPLALPPDVCIVLVTVDAMRADAIPPVRPADAAATTPFLDELVGRSTAFAHTYAQASTTLSSIPVMFRSIEAFESPDHVGRPFAHVMSDLDRRPLAVVNDWFIEDPAKKSPTANRIEALLDGFERVQVYAQRETDRFVPMALELVDDVAPEPFFVWIHVFALHAPGYDGRMLGEVDGDWPSRYARSLVWLDGQLRILWDGLDERGLLDRTVFVVASDHGEGLGDNGVERHGATVFEEEVRVPLLFYVPGRPPAVVDATVGNIDLVPTLVDLLGGPIDPVHRGRSVVPLLLAPDEPWSRAYYMQNRTGSLVALVQGHDKVVWDAEAGAAMRFDLQTDPKEDANRFTGSDDDELALARLFRLDPGLLAHELEDEETRAVLLGRIEAIDATTPTHELELLLRLVEHDPTGEAASLASARFDAVDDARVRLRLVAYLFASDRDAWADRIVKWLKTAPDPDALADALSKQGQPPFAKSWVGGQLAARLDAGPTAIRPWLRLACEWPRLPRATWASPLATILQRAHDDAQQDDIAALALRSARRVRGLSRDEPGTRALAEAIDPYVDNESATLQVEAIRALAGLGDAATERLGAVVRDEHRDVHVRRAALRVVARHRKAAAIPLIESAGEDPRLLVEAIHLLRDTRDLAAIPALQRLGQRPMDAKDQRRIRKAIGQVRDANR